METLFEPHQQLPKKRMGNPDHPCKENKNFNKTQRNFHRLLRLQRVHPAGDFQIHNFIRDKQRNPTMARKHAPLLDAGHHHGLLRENRFSEFPGNRQLPGAGADAQFPGGIQLRLETHVLSGWSQKVLRTQDAGRRQK